MLYEVKGQIICSTLTKRNNIYDGIQTWLDGHPEWDKRVSAAKSDYADESGTTSPSIDIYANMDSSVNKHAVFATVKAKLQTLTGITVILSKHDCSHDEVNRQPCHYDEVWSETF